MTTNLLGTVLGQYRLEKMIGEGGLATVYKGYQKNLDRWVAIKVLHSDDQHMLARFEREAKAVAKLRHRNILMVYEYGTADNRPFIAMEYVEGGTLEDLLTGEPMELSLVISNAMAVAEALHYAHQHGLIHRDVKPSNIMMPQGDWPLLADFGLVKVSDEDKALTATGMIMGTPAYIAPEQARGEKIGPHADMYALGVIMFEMIAGRPPFAYDNANFLMLAHIQESPPPPREFNPLCPPELETIILKTLEKSPEDRYADLQEVIGALQKLLGATTANIPTTSTLQIPSDATMLPLRPKIEQHRSPDKKSSSTSNTRLLIPDQNATIPLPEPGEKGLILGRNYGKNHVDIDLNPYNAMEAGISRRHSRLIKEGDEWLIDDLGSMNGTSVEKTKITPGTPVRLKNGDIIHCGGLYLIFLTSSNTT